MKKMFKILACFALFAALAPTVSYGQAEDTRTVMESFRDSIQQNNDKITINVMDFHTNVVQGNLEGFACVSKFGRALAGVQTTATDIWDRADATPTQQIWTAPSSAEQFNIVSTDAGDDGDPVGVGARTVTVVGLTDWDSGSISEVVTMNGTSNVLTDHSFVMIHRMYTTTNGTTSSNVGVITATAATAGSVGAEINASEGQTQMAIYGVPSSEVLYIEDWYGGITKASGSAATIDFTLVANQTPDTGTETVGFIVKNTRGVQSTGANQGVWPFVFPFKIEGPAIVKIQGVASAADMEGSAGFNALCADNNNKTPNNLLAGGRVSYGPGQLTPNVNKKLQDTHGRFLLHDSAHVAD